MFDLEMFVEVVCNEKVVNLLCELDSYVCDFMCELLVGERGLL